MATLILNANTASPITVTCQRAGKSAPRFVGSVTPSFQGALRSTVRGQAKVIPILASYVDTATEATIQAAVMNGVQIACSGDILGNLQTQCSFENVVSNMIPGLPGFFEMSFTLNEVQASVVLLKYAAGDTVTGEAFTRSTTAYYRNQGGGATPLSQAAINAKRDNHWLTGVRCTLLEDARTNQLIWANDFSNAAWVKTTCGVTTGIADPASGSTACTLTASAANSHCIQTLAAGSSLARTNSIWIRRRTGTGAVFLRDAPNTGFTDVGTGLSSTWTRYSISAAASTARSLDIQIATNGDAVDVWCGQMEDGSFASSEIPTTTVAVTRAADSYSLPFTTPPQETTVYARFVEGGTINTVNGTPVLVSDSASALPLFAIYAPSGLYTTIHNPSTNVSSPLAAAPVIGNTVELVGRLFGDGSVDISQSIGAAAATSGAQSAALALQPAWSGPLVWPNSAPGGVHGFTALQSLKIVAGCRSLKEMQAA